MFVDVAKIKIKSGNGGNGAVSFRREAFVTKGGPDGGDGGRGGSVFFVADPGLRTLMDFKYRHKFEAQDGANGSGVRRSGKDGQDLTIKVPLGTLIKNAATGEVLADMRIPWEEKRILRGGRGGWGNMHFATATRQTPNFAQPGQKTQAYDVILELKSIADVGLVGFPNVGKSTLLSMVTSAHPKIANYHFTTLSPNLGVAQSDGYSFNIADIPGLIENAHEGAGLGHDFLRHVERTRLLVHVLDASGCEGRDPVDDYYKIKHELESYSDTLVQRCAIIAANKTDIPEAQDNMPALQQLARQEGMELFEISAATGQGVQELMRRVAAILRSLPQEEVLFDEAGELDSLQKAEEYTITQDPDGTFIVTGSLPTALLASVNLDDETSMQYFERRLYESGIVDKLREMGAQHEDTVNFAGRDFEFWD